MQNSIQMINTQPPQLPPQQIPLNNPNVLPNMPKPPVFPVMPILPPLPVMQMPLNVPQQPPQQQNSNRPELPPSQTLYVNNLNYKYKPDVIRKTLLSLFHPCGAIKDILVGRKYALKGQAWVVFQNVDDAIKAKDQFQGCNVLERPIVFIY